MIVNHNKTDQGRCRRAFATGSAILALIFCVACLWSLHFVLMCHARTTAVRTIEECGGTVTYDYQWSPTKTWIPNAVPPGPEWARRLLGQNFAANVVEIQLFAGPNQHPEKFTDIEATQLAALTRLEWLVLTDTGITDAGLKHLSTLKKLERLDLERTKVSEAGAQGLHRVLPKVKIYFDDGMVPSK